MTIFFGTILSVANRFGALVALHPTNPYYKVLTFANLFSVVNVCFHTGYFYLQNINDFEKSTSVLGAHLNMLVHLSKIYILLVRGDTFLSVYKQLRRLCHDPMSKHFAAAQVLDKRVSLFGRIFIVFVLIVTVAITLNPLFVQFLEFYNTGQVVNFRWELPFPYANPFFDLKSSPGYEITYAFFAISIFPLGMFVISTDLLFMATCIHIRGLFHHLTVEMKDAMACPGDKEKLGKAVSLQNLIYRIVEDTEKVFGNIFFSQCIGTLVIVCTEVYLATKNLSNGRFVSYVAFSMAALSELVIYTYFGAMVTDGHQSLGVALNESDWYEWKGHQRRLLVMMIRQSQKECRISFLNWLHCSETTLRVVITNTYNLFAFLQQWERKK